MILGILKIIMNTTLLKAVMSMNKKAVVLNQIASLTTIRTNLYLDCYCLTSMMRFEKGMENASLIFINWHYCSTTVRVIRSMHMLFNLLHLVKVVAILPKFQAHRLKWNRFYNKYGGKGNNISLDLKKEQQNKVLKTFWRALGGKINENNGARVAHAVEQLEAIVESVNADCNYSGRVGRRSISNQEKCVQQIVDDLMKEKVFKFTEDRDGHPSFPQFSGQLLRKIDYRQVHHWVTDHIKLWGSIYEQQL